MARRTRAGVDWRHGALWFAETLVDADVAINAGMWQNGGHSGFDQWNFVMHPVHAAKAADPEGNYVRKWRARYSPTAAANSFLPAGWRRRHDDDGCVLRLRSCASAGARSWQS